MKRTVTVEDIKGVNALPGTLLMNKVGITFNEQHAVTGSGKSVLQLKWAPLEQETLSAEVEEVEQLEKSTQTAFEFNKKAELLSGAECAEAMKETSGDGAR